jgi:hypothetical protein
MWDESKIGVHRGETLPGTPVLSLPHFSRMIMNLIYCKMWDKAHILQKN